MVINQRVIGLREQIDLADNSLSFKDCPYEICEGPKVHLIYSGLFLSFLNTQSLPGSVGSRKTIWDMISRQGSKKMKSLCSRRKEVWLYLCEKIDEGKICVIRLNQNLIQFPSAKRSVHPNMIEGHGSMVGRMKQVIDLLESQYDWYCVSNKLRHCHIPMLSLLRKPISMF